MRTIEPASSDPEDNGHDVYEHGVYERSSVLHGQPKRSFLVHFDSLREAQAAYPDASVLEGSSKPVDLSDGSLADYSGLSSEPACWFDPADAGERWDDDY